MAKTRITLLAMIALIAGCGFGKQAQIDSYVEQEKGTLPKTMFGDVRVIDMSTGESEIIYFCDARQLNIEAGVNRVKNRMTRKAEEFVRENRDQLTRIIDNQVKMTFVARQDGSSELFRFTINPWEIE